MQVDRPRPDLEVLDRLEFQAGLDALDLRLGRVGHIDEGTAVGQSDRRTHLQILVIVVESSDLCTKRRPRSLEADFIGIDGFLPGWPVAGRVRQQTARQG